jgi:hypothetical protein
MSQPTELEKLRSELRRLEEEKAELERLRQAKIELLKAKLGMLPSRFASEHPVAYSLITASGSLSKENARKAAESLKHGGAKVMDYVEYVNEHPGKGIISYLKYKKDMKRKLVRV